MRRGSDGDLGPTLRIRTAQLSDHAPGEPIPVAPTPATTPSAIAGREAEQMLGRTAEFVPSGPHRRRALRISRVRPLVGRPRHLVRDLPLRRLQRRRAQRPQRRGAIERVDDGRRRLRGGPRADRRRRRGDAAARLVVGSRRGDAAAVRAGRRTGRRRATASPATAIASCGSRICPSSAAEAAEGASDRLHRGELRIVLDGPPGEGAHDRAQDGRPGCLRDDIVRRQAEPARDERDGLLPAIAGRSPGRVLSRSGSVAMRRIRARPTATSSASWSKTEATTAVMASMWRQRVVGAREALAEGIERPLDPAPDDVGLGREVAVERPNAYAGLRGDLRHGHASIAVPLEDGDGARAQVVLVRDGRPTSFARRLPPCSDASGLLRSRLWHSLPILVSHA